MGMHKEQLPLRTKVVVWESDCDWGQKIEDILYFDTKEEAEKYVASFNSVNTFKEVPSWYMFAEIVK